ncbi:MAG: Crp/Fnr family transcriptional regulator [Rhodospirillales bacterium]|tara:strand:+ start:7221 stop:7982 length:762 start_codon:yes stop_codon:yes gene_type:complete
MSRFDLNTCSEINFTGESYYPNRAVHLTENGGPTDNGPDIFKIFSHDNLKHLIERGLETRYHEGEHFFNQGADHDGIHLIKSGRVRSYYSSSNGREITLAYWPSGHFVGAPQILGGGIHMWSSIATEPSVGIRLPGSILRELIRDKPDLAIDVIESLVHKSMCYTSLLQIMGTQSKICRLSHLLLTFITPVPKEENSAEISLHFTQEELANMIGSTRQSISVSLDKFEKLGFIQRNGDSIKISDVRGLRNICS